MIIVTGFGPYGNYEVNVSSLIVQALDQTDYRIKLKKKVLPVSWNSSIKLYKEALKDSFYRPSFVILFGIQPKKDYSLELLSWNFAFGIDIDNVLKFGFIEHKLKLWLASTLDIVKLLNKLKNIVDIKQSYFSGLFLCNYIYFTALSLSRGKYPVLFIHIPHKERINRGRKIISEIIRTVISMQ